MRRKIRVSLTLLVDEFRAIQLGAALNERSVASYLRLVTLKQAKEDAAKLLKPPEGPQ